MYPSRFAADLADYLAAERPTFTPGDHLRVIFAGLVTIFGWQSAILFTLLAYLVYAAVRVWKYTRTRK
jgi:hypothetical protein